MLIVFIAKNVIKNGQDSKKMIKKKKEKLPKEFWVCPCCNKETHVYWETTLGLRCIKCVINYDMDFYWETEKGKRELVKAKWLINGNEFSKIDIPKEQNLNINLSS